MFHSLTLALATLDSGLIGLLVGLRRHSPPIVCFALYTSAVGGVLLI